jgi:uncharacterized small protein (DUF1192 family)
VNPKTKGGDKMKELRIKIPTTPEEGSQLSKQEEIAILDKIARGFHGTQTYLSSLFSGEFCNWVAARIQDDINPDIYHWLKDTDGRLTKEVDRLNKSWHSCESSFRDRVKEISKHCNDRLKAKQGEIKNLNEQLEIADNKCDEADEKISILTEDVKKLAAENNEATESREACRTLLDHKELQVTQLKAELWDMQQTLIEREQAHEKLKMELLAKDKEYLNS